MKARKNKEEDKIYVDPILIEEGFFDDEEDYEKTMNEVFDALRKATEELAHERKKQSAKRKTEDTKV
ncbi:hypothetical protein [Tunicatimonas pelagia]|uniref:hypothetical protein n=1 Tax=Tunicatimonas pelagia TaxID=931531 RepID=UPI00266522ED|nr:hypothetical protein [Tunicatimonas pelagia]WKN46534.1 hypothetical protein P0M28_30970 [Tunicatimonas pelagia]